MSWRGVFFESRSENFFGKEYFFNKIWNSGTFQTRQGAVLAGNLGSVAQPT